MSEISHLRHAPPKQQEEFTRIFKTNRHFIGQDKDNKGLARNAKVKTTTQSFEEVRRRRASSHRVRHVLISCVRTYWWQDSGRILVISGLSRFSRAMKQQTSGVDNVESPVFEATTVKIWSITRFECCHNRHSVFAILQTPRKSYMFILTMLASFFSVLPLERLRYNPVEECL